MAAQCALSIAIYWEAGNPQYTNSKRVLPCVFRHAIWRRVVRLDCGSIIRGRDLGVTVTPHPPEPPPFVFSFSSSHSLFICHGHILIPRVRHTCYFRRKFRRKISCKKAAIKQPVTPQPSRGYSRTSFSMRDIIEVLTRTPCHFWKGRSRVTTEEIDNQLLIKWREFPRAAFGSKAGLGGRIIHQETCAHSVYSRYMKMNLASNILGCPAQQKVMHGFSRLWRFECKARHGYLLGFISKQSFILQNEALLTSLCLRPRRRILK